MVVAIAFKNLPQPLRFWTGFVAAENGPFASPSNNERLWRREWIGLEVANFAILKLGTH
jgi:hypothetical protein